MRSERTASHAQCERGKSCETHLLHGRALVLPSKSQEFLLIQGVAVDLIKVVPKVRAHLVQRRAGQSWWQATLGGAL